MTLVPYGYIDHAPYTAKAKTHDLFQSVLCESTCSQLEPRQKAKSRSTQSMRLHNTWFGCPSKVSNDCLKKCKLASSIQGYSHNIASCLINMQHYALAQCAVGALCDMSSVLALRLKGVELLLQLLNVLLNKCPLII